MFLQMEKDQKTSLVTIKDFIDNGSFQHIDYIITAEYKPIYLKLSYNAISFSEISRTSKAMLQPGVLIKTHTYRTTKDLDVYVYILKTFSLKFKWILLSPLTYKIKPSQLKLFR